MEKHIQDIERINQYINNTLPSYERRLFELQIITDTALKTLYEEHRIFLGGLKRIKLKQDIQAARKGYLITKWIKYLVIGIGIIGLTILIYNLTFTDDETTPMDEGIGNQANQKDIKIKSRLKYPNNAIDSMLAKIRSKPIAYSIQGNKDTILTSKKGTLISIPANTFQNKNGGIVTGQIQIELIETVNTSDFLLHNLHTTSSDRILQSGGMFFMDATENKKPIAIRKGMSVAIKTKTNYANPKMSLFSGSIENNELDWQPISGMNDNYLIAIPFDLLNYNWCSFECYYSEDQIKDFKQEKYANSYIATQEFEQRMCYLSYFSCDHQSPIDDEILSIYKENYTKNLTTVDSLVLKYLKDNLSKFIKPGYNDDKFHFDNSGWITSIYQGYQEFIKQELTKPLDLSTLNIRFPISKNELLSKGYNEIEANNIINYMQIQNEVIQVKKDQDEANRLTFYSFSITKLGWVNIDMFQDDQACKLSDFFVEINTTNTFESLSVSLVIPRRNVVIPSIYRTDSTYHFTQEKNGYRFLPINEDAIIIAIGVKNNQPFFGKRKIKIPATGKVDVTITTSKKQDILEAINSINEN